MQNPEAQKSARKLSILFEDTIHLLCAFSGKTAPVAHKGCGKVLRKWKDGKFLDTVQVWEFLKQARIC